MPEIFDLTDPPAAGPPQRLIDEEEVFVPKADDSWDWLYALIPEIKTSWIPSLIAVAAASAPVATSTSSVAIGTGTKTFADEATLEGKQFGPGDWVIMSDSAAPTTNYMIGQVSTYDLADGELVVSVPSTACVFGSGTKAAWNIHLTGVPFFNTSGVETVYEITDGASVSIDSGNGGMQTWDLGDNRTPAADSIAEGAFVLLRISDGSAYAVTWSTMSPTWVDGTAPTLPTSGYAVVIFWKQDSVLYGKYVGNVA